MKSLVACEIQNVNDFHLNFTGNMRQARKIMIKPNLGAPFPHPVTTSLQTLQNVINQICDETKADIVLIEGPCYNKHFRCIVSKLNIARNVQVIDVRDCPLVEVKNPLNSPFILPTILLPRIALECDYRISLASYKIYPELSSLSIKNLIGLLPIEPYSLHNPDVRDYLHHIGIHKVIADLYFTFPIDLAIVDARKRLIGGNRLCDYYSENWGRIYIGSPIEVDSAILTEVKMNVEYFHLISHTKKEEIKTNRI